MNHKTSDLSKTASTCPKLEIKQKYMRRDLVFKLRFAEFKIGQTFENHISIIWWLLYLGTESRITTEELTRKKQNYN